MASAMNIFYEVHGNLYVNLTNRCSCNCTFCLRNAADGAHGSDTLWLDHEPTLQEAEEALRKIDLSCYEEVVFCGYGEPTCALGVMLPLIRIIKEQAAAQGNPDLRIRLNTNGHGSLIAGRDICPELAGLVDAVSISLNTPDAEEYLKLNRSQFGEEAYEGMLQFAKEVGEFVPEVTLTTVATTLTSDEEQECEDICQELGVNYRIRPWVD